MKLTMPSHRLASLAAALFGAAALAHADQFVLTYHDTGLPNPDGYYTSANICLSGNLIGTNTYLITGATGVETVAETFYPYTTFHYNISLYPNPNASGAPNQVNFYGGYFVYDNVLTFPAGTGLFLDINGLLLIAENNPIAGAFTGINLYSTSYNGGTYFNFQLENPDNWYDISSTVQAKVKTYVITRISP